MGTITGSSGVEPDDTFLMIDRNNDGMIDKGRELFGDSSPLANAGAATDGFAALARADTNNDGKVDFSDARFNQLRIWRDISQDEVSQANELFTLTRAGMEFITVTKSTRRGSDRRSWQLHPARRQHGNPGRGGARWGAVGRCHPGRRYLPLAVHR